MKVTNHLDVKQVGAFVDNHKRFRINMVADDDNDDTAVRFSAYLTKAEFKSVLKHIGFNFVDNGRV